jgi:hypothetical protein
MDKYHIRFNTLHGDTELVWRIFENDVEMLASEMLIKVPVYGEETIEFGVRKWNIACKGKAVWTGTKVVIE